MFLRRFTLNCRLCGARKSLWPTPNSHQNRVVDGVLQQRCYSEKFRDPKNFRWATGRPDDPPRKTRPKASDVKNPEKWTSRPDSSCEKKDPPPKTKASDVKNPEKWTGRPDSTCTINPKNQSPQQPKTDKPKDTPKKSPKVGQTKCSGPAKLSSGLTAVQVGSTKKPPLHQVMPLLEEVKSVKTPRQPPCFEGMDTKAPTVNNVEPSSASVFATQFNVGHQGMPELVSSYARSVEAAEEFGKNSISVDKIRKLSDVLNAAKSESSPPPSGVTSKTGGNLKKFHAIPEVKLSGSSLKNHVAEIQKEQKSGDSPENPERSKRVDITVPKLPPAKIVNQTFDEAKRHRLYSFGLAETGALGFHKPNEGRRWRKYMARPLRHQFAEENRVISAEAGYGFTLFYVQSDNPIKLYGCGINTDFQLGPTDDEVVTYPNPIDLRISSPKTKIVSFSAGRAHSVVATDKEGVFLFGSNSYGQCGRVVEEEEPSGGCTITQIRGFSGEKVATVSCGQDHTCFVTESGKVYACGWGSEGQTGQGHCMHVAEPCQVTGDIGSEKIVKISGKCDTVLALSEKGNLFGWGSNEFRQLRDDPDVAQVDTPIALENVHRKCGKIIDVAAGSSFCLILNQERDVYVWGYGILGAGPELVKTSVPTLLPRTLFGANDYQPMAAPAKVFCGVDHMAVLNNLKHVYAWGKNKHGCLGIGNARDQYFPYKLAISADTIHVSCAVDHSVVVTDHQ